MPARSDHGHGRLVRAGERVAEDALHHQEGAPPIEALVEEPDHAGEPEQAERGYLLAHAGEVAARPGDQQLDRHDIAGEEVLRLPDGAVPAGPERGAELVTPGDLLRDHSTKSFELRLRLRPGAVGAPERQGRGRLVSPRASFPSPAAAIIPPSWCDRQRSSLSPSPPNGLCRSPAARQSASTSAISRFKIFWWLRFCTIASLPKRRKASSFVPSFWAAVPSTKPRRASVSSRSRTPPAAGARSASATKAAAV